jgi:hypothetical protein
MIELSRAYFRFEVPAPDEANLLAFARAVFQDFDRAADQLFPLPDYAVYVAVEEGSIKGGGKILAAAGAAYLAIAQFGSFVQGVREIDRIHRGVQALSWPLRPASSRDL